MSDDQNLKLPPHVLAERNPARALRMLLDIPQWRAIIAESNGMAPDELVIDEESMEEAARSLDEPMTPDEMTRADETFERVAAGFDDFVLEQTEIDAG